MNRLTDFTADIFDVLEEDNPEIRDLLRECRLLAKVKNVESNWVWGYINFKYEAPISQNFTPYEIIGSDWVWFMNDIETPFTVVALVNDQGVLSCFEIVTYADVGWDGEIREWRYEKFELIS